MSAPADDLLQVAAEVEVEQAELDAVIDVDGTPVDRRAALDALHAESDDDQPCWRRAA